MFAYYSTMPAHFPIHHNISRTSNSYPYSGSTRNTTLPSYEYNNESDDYYDYLDAARRRYERQELEQTQARRRAQEEAYYVIHRRRQAEARTRAELEARYQAETEARLRAEAKARAQAEAEADFMRQMRTRAATEYRRKVHLQQLAEAEYRDKATAACQFQRNAIVHPSNSHIIVQRLDEAGCRTKATAPAPAARTQRIEAAHPTRRDCRCHIGGCDRETNEPDNVNVKGYKTQVTNEAEMAKVIWKHIASSVSKAAQSIEDTADVLPVAVRPIVESSSASQAQVASQSAKPLVRPISPSRPPMSYTAAVHLVQGLAKSQLSVRRHLHSLQMLRGRFEEIQKAFVISEPLVFDSEKSTAGHLPVLAYSPSNRPLQTYEEGLIKLFTDLDAIASNGSERIRTDRKALAVAIEAELNRVDAIKDEAWKAQQARENPGPVVETPAPVSAGQAEFTLDEQVKGSHAATSGIPKEQQEQETSSSLPDKDITPAQTLPDESEDNKPHQENEMGNSPAIQRDETISADAEVLQDQEIQSPPHSDEIKQIDTKNENSIGATPMEDASAKNTSTESEDDHPRVDNTLDTLFQGQETGHLDAEIQKQDEAALAQNTNAGVETSKIDGTSPASILRPSEEVATQETSILSSPSPPLLDRPSVETGGGHQEGDNDLHEDSDSSFEML